MHRASRWTAIVVAPTLAAAIAFGAAQETYLGDIASDPEHTHGEARLLHYLPTDMPIDVWVEAPDREDAEEARDRVIEAFRAWEDAAPGTVSFRVVERPTDDALRVSWRALDDRVGTYRYRYDVLDDGRYRFRTSEVWLDPRHDLEALFRYALLQAGHALGLLGRSPYEGDAMSAVPSGQITERDIATLRALYGVPSGTPVDPATD